MSFFKTLTGFIAALAFLILIASDVQACTCVPEPGGGFSCDAHCTAQEIREQTGAGDASPDEADPLSGECYTNVEGDYVCPQSGAEEESGVAPLMKPPAEKSGVVQGPPESASSTPDIQGQTQEPAPANVPLTPFEAPEGAYQWPLEFACAVDASLGGPAPDGQQAGEWNLTFNEEFDGFDPSVWNDAIWYEIPNPAKNYTVEDGALKIWPQRDESGNFFNRTIDTDGKFNQTYGYFEMEAKLPVGKGVWPAFWLFNHIGERRPEMDIMEAYPGGGPESGWGDSELHPVAFAATIWPDGINAGNAGHKTLNTEDLSDGFHTYAVQWEEDRQIYYFDGQPFFESEVRMQDPMYIILDLWFGSASGQPDDSTPQGINNSFVVNYVRAWERCGSAGGEPEETPISPAPEIAACVPVSSAAAQRSGKTAVEETFDGDLSSLGHTLAGARHVELAKGMGVNGSNALRVDYVGSSQGSERVTARYPLPPALEYTLSFDVNFCSGFDFVKGGKLHGLGPDNPITGGNSVPDAGWSARGMFRPGGTVQSYVYSQNMKGKYGEGVLTDSFKFQPGRYYAVSYQVGLNNPASASNGYMKVFIDGRELISHENIKFRDTDDPKSLISTLLFNTFHGGHTSEWAPKNADGSYATDCAYYDNFAASAATEVRDAPQENICAAE